MDQLGDVLKRLEPDSPEGCPYDAEQVWAYTRMESADGEASRRESLRFVRTAEIHGDRFWLWEFTEADGCLCYVYAQKRPSGRSLLALVGRAGSTPEEFLAARVGVEW